jgi:cell division protein FtsB
VRSLPDHVVIDRLVRGRAWIPVLGLMLAGIVAMQVEVLKLGAGIGRAVQQTTTLSSVNQQLRATVANLSDDQRIESMAQRLGMIMPGPTEVGFVSGGASVQAALGGIHAPSLNDFLNAPSHGNGAVAGIGTGGSSSGAGPATTAAGATTGAATTTGATTTTGAATTTGG